MTLAVSSTNYYAFLVTFGVLKGEFSIIKSNPNMHPQRRDSTIYDTKEGFAIFGNFFFFFLNLIYFMRFSTSK